MHDGGGEVGSSSDVIVDQWARERPDVDMARYGVLLRIRALAMLIDRLTDDTAKALGLSTSELYVLFALRRGGKPYRMRPTDIYKLLRVTSGTITYRIDSLEKAGLVERLADPQDRRSVVIQLTAKGRRLADTAFDLSVSSLGGSLKEILHDPMELQATTSVLRKLGLMFDQVMAEGDNPLIHDKAPARPRAPVRTQRRA